MQDRYSDVGSVVGRDPDRPCGEIGDLPESVRGRIILDGGHWRWTGGLNKGGYGRLELPRLNGRRRAVLAHRLVWSLLGGVLDGDLHHGCDLKACVWPDHLSRLTPSEHSKHHHPLSETCSAGHEFTERNTYWRRDRKDRPSRQCRRCKADRMARYKLARRNQKETK